MTTIHPSDEKPCPYCGYRPELGGGKLHTLACACGLVCVATPRIDDLLQAWNDTVNRVAETRDPDELFAVVLRGRDRVWRKDDIGVAFTDGGLFVLWPEDSDYIGARAVVVSDVKHKQQTAKVRLLSTEPLEHVDPAADARAKLRSLESKVHELQSELDELTTQAKAVVTHAEHIAGELAVTYSVVYELLEED